MLPGQVLQHLIEPEAFRDDFGLNFFHAHLMLCAYRDSRVFLAEFQQHKTSVIFQSLPELLQHHLGLRKFVIYIDQQDQIHQFRRQLRIGFGPEDRYDVGYLGLGRPLLQHGEHFGLDIVGVYLACRANATCNPNTEISDPRTHISHSHTFLNTYRVQSGFGHLLNDPLGSFEPFGTADAHDRSDSAPSNGMLLLGERTGALVSKHQQRQDAASNSSGDLPICHNPIKVGQAMSVKPVSSHRFPGLAALLFSALLISGCGNASVEIPKDSLPNVTYQMGQGVQLGPLTYNVLETNWKSQLGGGPAARIPKNRYLLVKLTITNRAGQTSSIPGMALLNAAGQSFQELTEGVESVPKWLGVLRNLSPVQTEEGIVVFDVPLGAYKLQVSDGGEIGSEKKALIEIPLQLE